MASAKDIVAKVIAAMAVSAMIVGVYNTISDNTLVLKAARLVLACPTESECQLSRIDRRPWEQRFEIFYRGRGQVVRCSPRYLLVGEWKCRVTDEVAQPPHTTR
jgi:hypothetical protein